MRRTPPPLLTRESDGDVYEDREEGGEEEGEEEDDEEVAAQEEIARLAEEAGLVPLGLAWVSYGHVALAVLMDVAHIRSRAHVKALLRAVQPELTLLDNHVAAQQAARAACCAATWLSSSVSSGCTARSSAFTCARLRMCATSISTASATCPYDTHARPSGTRPASSARRAISSCAATSSSSSSSPSSSPPSSLSS